MLDYLLARRKSKRLSKVLTSIRISRVAINFIGSIEQSDDTIV